MYRLYYDFEQALSKLQGHQILAINRGEKEGVLKVSVTLDRDQALPPAAPGGGEARISCDGIYQVRRRGRLRPADLPSS